MSGVTTGLAVARVPQAAVTPSDSVGSPRCTCYDSEAASISPGKQLCQWETVEANVTLVGIKA